MNVFYCARVLNPGAFCCAPVLKEAASQPAAALMIFCHYPAAFWNNIRNSMED
jgi:hypothetical protein